MPTTKPAGEKIDQDTVFSNPADNKNDPGLCF